MNIIEFYKDKESVFCNIIDFKPISDLDPEVGEWGANRPEEVTSLSDGAIIKEMAQKMLANFYLKMNRPKKTTRFFNNLRASIDWSLDRLEKERKG